MPRAPAKGANVWASIDTPPGVGVVSPERRGRVEMGNPVVHFEINGPDDELVAKYYSELFGWHIQQIPGMEYATIDTHGGAGINGGIGRSEQAYSSIVVETDDVQG